MRIPRIPARILFAAIVILAAAAVITTVGTGSTQATGPTGPQVQENTPGGSAVGSPLEAQASGATVRYALSGKDAASFTIDAESGKISLAQGVSPNFEVNAQYSVTITATAGITVRVLNVDEPGNVTLSSDEPNAGDTVTAVLTDPDGEVTNLQWSWKRSADGENWNSITGATGASYTTVTDDISHRIAATALYDDAAATGRQATATTTKAVRNNPPEFPEGTIARQVNENSSAGTTVGSPVTATDPNGNGISYSGSGDTSFQVNPQSGQITVAQGAALDHESRDSHDLTVTATDSHGDSASKTITISITNVEEAATLTMEYGPLRRGTVLTTTLSDPDGSISGQTWQWSRSSSAIQEATASSYTAASADVGHVLQVSVQYTDGHGPGKSAQASTQSAVGNDAPMFAEANPSREINENASAGSAVGTPVTATDPNNDATTYSLSGSGFTVDQNGQITNIAALDHEVTQSHTAQITATDSHGASTTVMVTITVNNIEEGGTVTLSQASPQVGDTITASLSDPDGSISGEIWQWQSAERATGTWSNITGATSGSYTATADDLDQYLQASASYTDGHGTTQDTASAVTDQGVQPEPNRPPTFDAATTSFNISINVREGVRAAPPFTAQDPNGDTLAYSIVSDTVDAFTINTATGEVLMGSAEITVDTTYTATISVTDGMDADRNADTANDDSLSLTMTMVNPNIVVDPVSNQTFPYGLWVGDDIAVTTNNGTSEDWVLFYDRNTQAGLTDRNFEITTPTFPAPKGVWSDGETLYLLVINEGASKNRGKIYGYSLASGNRAARKDIRLANANGNPAGLTGHDGRLYVADTQDNKVYAYDVETRSRSRDHDIAGIDRLNKHMTDLWLNDETLWVSYWRSDFIRAYDTATGTRKPSLDIQTAAENRGPTGIDSDGFNLWAMDQVNDTIYGYIIPQ